MRLRFGFETGRKILTKREDKASRAQKQENAQKHTLDGVCPEADDGIEDNDSPTNDDGSPVEDTAPVDSSSTPRTSDANTKNYVFAVGPNIYNAAENSPEKCTMGERNCEFKGWTQITRDNDLFQGFMKHPDVVNVRRAALARTPSPLDNASSISSRFSNPLRPHLHR